MNNQDDDLEYRAKKAPDDCWIGWAIRNTFDSEPSQVVLGEEKPYFLSSDEIAFKVKITPVKE